MTRVNFIYLKTNSVDSIPFYSLTNTFFHSHSTLTHENEEDDSAAITYANHHSRLDGHRSDYY